MMTWAGFIIVEGCLVYMGYRCFRKIKKLNKEREGLKAFQHHWTHTESWDDLFERLNINIQKEESENVN